MEGIDIYNHSTMRHWQTTDRGFTLKTLFRHTQYVFALRSMRHKPSERNVQQDQPAYCGQNQKNKNRRVVAVQVSDATSTSKTAHNSGFVSRNLVSQVTHAFYGMCNKSEETVMDSDLHRIVYDTNSYTILRCRQIAEAEFFWLV